MRKWSSERELHIPAHNAALDGDGDDLDDAGDDMPALWRKRKGVARLRFLKDLIGLLVGLAGLFALFAMAMMPQIGLIWFVHVGGGPMLLPIIALSLLGKMYSAVRRANGRQLCGPTAPLAFPL